ncbi:Hsp20 family protein [Agrobacterium rosae]|uniref:Hsp20 family protein n=1 Tax=Agrobacterium rosae TaxID=1972867 RepID=UPI0019D39B23|nr:Hsp20 family protein [Agrobacterium rosae]MBN7808497.1 Hsp20 family protein [Agrobacterium rosae]
MSRMTPFTHPLMLGFDAMEKTLERMTKANDGYPPYNIERLAAEGGSPERLRITIAVAGFSEDDLEVTTADNQLIIRGRQQEQDAKDYLYRGIAARQFQRVFVLAEGMQVNDARLRNGLLSIDLTSREISNVVKKINISVSQ